VACGGCVSVPESDVQQKMKFKFDPAFYNPKPLQGKQVIWTLWDMEKIVRKVIFDLASAGVYA
jgi:hypothetical protein